MRIPFCLSTGGAVQDILSEVDVRDEASVIVGAAPGAVGRDSVYDCGLCHVV